jgi:hypothetical protein
VKTRWEAFSTAHGVCAAGRSVVSGRVGPQSRTPGPSAADRRRPAQRDALEDLEDVDKVLIRRGGAQRWRPESRGWRGVARLRLLAWVLLFDRYRPKSERKRESRSANEARQGPRSPAIRSAAMAPVLYWINLVVPGVEIFVNPDDVEDDEVLPEVREFLDSVAAQARSRGWIVRGFGCDYHDDRPPQWYPWSTEPSCAGSSKRGKSLYRRPSGSAEAWARIGHSHPPSAGDGRTQPDITRTAPDLVHAGRALFSLVSKSGQGRGRTADLPLFRRNNHPPHGLPTEVDGGRSVPTVVHGG